MWNYRIINVSDEEQEELEIQEVYYDRKGEPYAHCRGEVFGIDLQELDHVLTHMRDALDKPILTAANFTGDPNDDTI